MTDRFLELDAGDTEHYFRVTGRMAPRISVEATAESLTGRILDMRMTADGLQSGDVAEEIRQDASFLEGQLGKIFGISIG